MRENEGYVNSPENRALTLWQANLSPPSDSFGDSDCRAPLSSRLDRSESRMRVRPLEVGVEQTSRLVLIAWHQVPIAIERDAVARGCP
jgi:hypothetical protein